jgi:CDP-glucose 4,6-dehydratase
MPTMNQLFGGIYQGRRVLVTGHTGFKGSWLVFWLRCLGAQVSTLALPASQQPSHHELLQGLGAAGRLDGLEEALIDIRDGDLVKAAMNRFAPEVVFHLAAQALVRPSYADAPETWSTNVMGLVQVLEAVRACPCVKAMLNVTTDKCYDNRHSEVGYVETDALGGFDPYSASKAAAEIVSASYRASFLANRAAGPVALATARAGNVIGGGDWSVDRLVPDLVRAAVASQVVPIRHPQATRPWQHVLEPLSGYLLLGQKLLQDPQAASQAWNFGPAAAGHLSVGAVVESFTQHWPQIRCELDAGPHPHEAQLLHLDCTKAHQQLNWHPVWSAATMIERTASWYQAWASDGEIRTEHDLQGYIHDAHLAGLEWAS